MGQILAGPERYVNKCSEHWEQWTETSPEPEAVLC